MQERSRAYRKKLRIEKPPAPAPTRPLQLRSSSLGNALLVKRRNWRSAEDDIASLTTDQLEDAAKVVADGSVSDDPVIQRLQRNNTHQHMPLLALELMLSWPYMHLYYKMHQVLQHHHPI
jgi:hypothetical protein